MPKCKILENHACLSVSGEYMPCCRFQGKPRDPVMLVPMNEYRGSATFLELKNTMEKDWHPGCIRCERDEKLGKESQREFFNKILSGAKNQIESLELSFSNSCNLTCRMCDPSSSSSWNSMLKKNVSLKSYCSEAPQVSEDLFQTVLSQIDFSKIRFLKYLGGEPFLTKEINSLFSFLEEASLISNIDFSCVTNGSVFPTDLVGSLRRFRHVEINISVDGTEILCDYIRSGASWNAVYENILKWREFKRETGANIKLFTTVQAYNIHNVQEISLVAQELGLTHNYHFLRNPNFLSLRALPPEYIRLIRPEEMKRNHRLLPLYRELTSTPFEPSLFSEFQKFTLLFDKIKKVEISKTIPELFEFFNESGLQT
jgi:sulfatase maturation enzyme AslB (radical SAM superfamily)